jgi:hypothetical protein
MKNIKNALTALTLIAVLVFGTTFANAGIIVAGAVDNGDPCTQTKKSSELKTKADFGIIVAGITGIIVAGFTGIIVAGVSDDTDVNCGIIVAG